MAVGQWNSFMDTYLYARDLPTLQYVLYEIMEKATTRLIRMPRTVKERGISDVDPNGNHDHCNGSDPDCVSVPAAVFCRWYDDRCSQRLITDRASKEERRRKIMSKKGYVALMLVASMAAGFWAAVEMEKQQTLLP